MSNIIKATTYRLSKTITTKVCFAIATVAAVLYFVLSYQVACGNMGAETAGSISGLCDSMILWLTGPLLTGVIFCTDFASKSVHYALAEKGGRRSVIFGYAILYVAIILIQLLPYTLTSLVSMIAGWSFAGAEPAMTSIYLKNTLYAIGDVSILKLLLLYMVNAFVFVGSISICIPIAMKVKKPVVITAFGFMFGMLVALLSTVMNKVDALKAIWKCTPFAYTVTNLNLESSYGTMLLALAVSLLFTALMTGFAYLLFKKEEIK